MSRAGFCCAAIAAISVLALAACGGDGPEGVPRVDTGGGAQPPVIGGTPVGSESGQTTNITTVVPDEGGPVGNNTGSQDAGAINSLNDPSTNPDDDDFIGIDEIDDFTNLNDIEDFTDLDEFGRFVFGPNAAAGGSGAP